VLIGPKSDPAGVIGKDIQTALKAIQANGRAFVSRRRHQARSSAEHALWKQAISISRTSSPGSRDRAGHGDGAQYRGGNERLCAVGSRHLDRIQEPGDLEIVVDESDKRLFNQYGVMLVKPGKISFGEEELGRRLIDLLVSPKARRDRPATRSMASSCSFPCGRGG